MHALNLYIDEELAENSLSELKSELMQDSHIANVAFSRKQPHDMLVEYDEAYVQPSSIVSQLTSHGLHVDVIGG